MTEQINFVVSFTAGLASFLSPCVIAVIPGYLGIIGAANLSPDSGKIDRVRHTLAVCALFILGFSLSFISMGAAASSLGYILRSHKALLGKLMGVIIISFGLQQSGLVRLPLLSRERKIDVSAMKWGVLTPIIIGIAFGLAWTPCVGPILGSILALATNSENVSKGVSMLVAYSLGMAVPFLSVALLSAVGINLVKGWGKYTSILQKFIGIIFIILGCLLLFNRFDAISAFLLNFTNGWTPDVLFR